MGNTSADIGATTAADLAQIHDIFTRADELYRWYRAALLNRKRKRNEPELAEWIPISEH